MGCNCKKLNKGDKIIIKPIDDIFGKDNGLIGRIRTVLILLILYPVFAINSVFDKWKKHTD